VIGRETNVLARYLTQDDPAQSRRATGVIAEAARRGDRCVINTIVLCELVWVLRYAYEVDRAVVAATLDRILDTAQFVIEDKDLARRALADYRQGPGDFSDYLIGWRNRQAGCSATATFDQALKGNDLFRLV
jgi:predicted nucleic-acid-binding protein